MQAEITQTIRGTAMISGVYETKQWLCTSMINNQIKAWTNNMHLIFQMH